MTCPCCARKMEQTTTTFTVARGDMVYVVYGVPTFQCDCGHVSYSQHVAKQLERYTSGRTIPNRRPQSAWVFDWGKPATEIPANSAVHETVNAALTLTTRGT